MIVPAGGGIHGGNCCQAADVAVVIEDPVSQVSNADHRGREEGKASQERD